MQLEATKVFFSSLPLYLFVLRTFFHCLKSTVQFLDVKYFLFTFVLYMNYNLFVFIDIVGLLTSHIYTVNGVRIILSPSSIFPQARIKFVKHAFAF